jgi:hypothetical protein
MGPARPPCANMFVNPGDHIPAIPAHPFKTGAEFTIADAWKFGDDVNVVGSRNLVHDDANQNRKVPAHAESCKRDHASPPLGKLADINVVFPHEVELAIRTHAEHRKASR